MRKIILFMSALFLCLHSFAQSRIFENTLSSKHPVTTSINPGLVQEVGVYPNPSTGKIFLSLSGFKGKRVQVRVTNVIGNVVLQNSFNETDDLATKTIDLSTFNKGLYYVKIEADKYNELRKVYII
ncbi:MAG: T9SS type A sorting domain-containing protein [Bacteroidota bacterium]|nr:T9SS type A sorting domain-containing protein [Bacteroidota bacterium]